MTNNFFYLTPQRGKATKHLRSVGLNSITWEHFTGDFDSVIRYLEKVSKYIWGKWEIDTTEFYNAIVTKEFLKSWDEKYLPKDWKYHSHFIIEETGHVSEFGDWDCIVKVLDVHTLASFENDLHSIIAEKLEEK